MNSPGAVEGKYDTIDLRGARSDAPRGVWSTPASGLYGFVSSRVRSSRLRRRAGTPENVTVISIGNLELGGNGKTPLAIHVLRSLRARGARPVYVGRGYRSAAADRTMVTVCSDPGAVQPSVADRAVALVPADARYLARRLGDEGAVVSARCEGVPLFLSGRKVDAMSAALRMASPTHVVVDDAFQTWVLDRDVDIVLLDARRPFGNGKLLPAGTLREMPSAIRRADFVGFNGVSSSADITELKERIGPYLRPGVRVFGMRRRIQWLDGRGGGAVASVERAAVLSGIARPSAFERDVVEEGFDVRLAVRFPDHHRYGEGDIAVLHEAVQSHGVRWCITTEKDWVKLRDFDLPLNVCVARLDVTIEGIDLSCLTEKPQARPAARS